MNRYVGKRVASLAAIAAVVVWAFHTVTSPGHACIAAAIAENTELQTLRDRLTGQLARLSGKTSAAGYPPETIWSGSDRLATEAELQEKTLALAEANGLKLTSFGSAQAPTQVKSPTIAYQVEATASWEGLVHFVAGLNDVTPPLALSDLAVRSGQAGGAGEQPQLLVRIVVWGLAPEVGEGQ